MCRLPRDELFLNEGVRILRPAYCFGIRRELGVAVFTQAQHRNIILSFDDPKRAFHHATSSPSADPLVLMCLVLFLFLGRNHVHVVWRFEKAAQYVASRHVAQSVVYASTACFSKVELTTSKV
jgi:hypothetical protein